MALDLKKPIGKKAGGKEKLNPKKYPSRTAINLVYKEKRTKADVLSLAMFAVFLVILAVFTKFLVIDQLAKVNAAEAAYSAAERQLKSLKEANEQYAEVEEEYSHFGIGYLTQSELNTQDRMQMLKVIDEKLKPYNKIRTISIKDNTATVSFDVEVLQEVSDIVASLKENDYVSFVSFSTAKTEEKRIVTDADGDRHEVYVDTIFANIVITFRTPLEYATVQAEAQEGGKA